MDKICLEQLEFFAYHGCFEEEKTQGQIFRVSLVLETDVRAAAATDDLALTIDCGAVYDDVKDVTVNCRFDLIETLAERIAARLLGDFTALQRLTVRVDKPCAPGRDGVFHSAVEIVRSRP